MELVPSGVNSNLSRPRSVEPSPPHLGMPTRAGSLNYDMARRAIRSMRLCLLERVYEKADCEYLALCRRADA